MHNEQQFSVQNNQVVQEDRTATNTYNWCLSFITLRSPLYKLRRHPVGAERARVKVPAFCFLRFWRRRRQVVWFQIVASFTLPPPPALARPAHSTLSTFFTGLFEDANKNKYGGARWQLTGSKTLYLYSYIYTVHENPSKSRKANCLLYCDYTRLLIYLWAAYKLLPISKW